MSNRGDDHAPFVVAMTAGCLKTAMETDSYVAAHIDGFLCGHFPTMEEALTAAMAKRHQTIMKRLGTPNTEFK